jgi:hypothetical protein
MDTISVYFTKFLGKKILYKNKELTLHAVGLGFLLCMNGDLEFTSVPVDECKIICEDKREYMKFQIPFKLVVIKTEDGKYLPLDESTLKNDDEKEDDIVKTICKCAGITLQYFNKNHKKRKKELVQARQVHMIIRHLVIYKHELLSDVGAIYGKDHATVLNAKKRVLNALDGYDIEFRERFREAFDLTLTYYPDAHEKLNLKWL